MSTLYRVQVSQLHHVTIDIETETAQEAAECAQQGGGETVDVWQEEPAVKRVVKLETCHD